MELLASHPSCVPYCVASSFELVCWVCNSNLRCLNILAYVQVKLYLSGLGFGSQLESVSS